PMPAITPPLTNPGSVPSSRRAVTIMPVEVVLPCAPATETMRCPWMSQLRASERCSTGIPESRARRYSGLSCHSAPVTTTVSASPTLAASWPIAIVAPASRRRAIASESRTSEPVTRCPASSSRRAMPLIPEPPMPTKCTEPSSSGSSWSRSGEIIPSTLPFRARRRRRGGDRLLHEVDEAVGPIAPTGRRHAGRHVGDERRVLEQLQEGAAHPLGVELRIRNEQRAARVDGLARVEGLLTVAHRVGHEDRRDAEGRELAHGCGAGAGDGEIRGGQGEVHAVAVFE